VEKVRISDHFPIWLELGNGSDKPKAPFKYNPSWAVEEEFRSLVSENWKKYDLGNPESASVQFVASLRVVKEKAISWAHERHLAQDRNLFNIEEELKSWYETYVDGSFTVEATSSIKSLELKKAKLLLDQEKDWRIKSRATWLTSGIKTLNISNSLLITERSQIQSGT
jgi:hypothetical protein